MENGRFLPAANILDPPVFWSTVDAGVSLLSDQHNTSDISEGQQSNLG